MSASIKSQLVNLPSVSGTVIASLSLFGMFIKSDIIKGDALRAYRATMIRNAVEQAFKGNADDIKKASDLANGKAKLARAYHAGFAVLLNSEDPANCLKKVPYTGALARTENAPARDIIDSKTAHSTAEFFRAFDTVMSVAPVKRAVAVAETAPVAVAETAPVAVAVSAPAVETAEPEASVNGLGLTLDEMAIIVANAVRHGTLDRVSIIELDSALDTIAADIRYESTIVETETETAMHA